MSEIDRDRSYARTSSELEDTRAKLEECREKLREQEADSETVFATQQQTIQMLRRQLEALQEAVAASNAASSEEGEASPTAVFRRQLHEKNQVIQTLQQDVEVMKQQLSATVTRAIADVENEVTSLTAQSASEARQRQLELASLEEHLALKQSQVAALEERLAARSAAADSAAGDVRKLVVELQTV